MVLEKWMILGQVFFCGVVGVDVRESGLEKGVSVIKEVSYRVVCHWSFIRMVFSVVFHQGDLSVVFHQDGLSVVFHTDGHFSSLSSGSSSWSFQ